MGKRVNVDGPGDDPDEYWFECEDCEGTGTVNVPDGLDESTSVSAECPGCGGLGFYEGDADDVDD
ncbi:hypothetical protein Misp01_52310 [Microtetraspora sp. NBRC 13810]|uniref:hypothetical protein n=1 Tax=Microtetraspora sp. NBRC 13810 TaxID=3030990 RepID=UPI002552524E|nr:hypothetical protein [Microtetraspora sp. NBRC 13810]GLW10102.1 hypothetical protein Misp01_52310 [Microtetraspora sp. NBRC 13810]